MKILLKKETLVQNMTYMAFMAAINVIFVILTLFIPFLLFVLVFILPLSSALVCLACKKRYYIIYFVATIAICCVISLSDALFYILPSLITGFIFGLLINKKIPPIYMIVIITILQFVITYSIIPLINFITGRDIVNDLAIIFKVQDFKYLSYLKNMFIYFIALAQSIISYIVLASQIHKFGFNLHEVKESLIIDHIIVIILLLLELGIAFLFPEVSYLLLFTAIIISIHSFIQLLHQKRTGINLILSIGIIVSTFLLGIFFNYLSAPYSLLLIGIFPFVTSIIGLTIYICFKKQIKIQ